MKVITKNYVLDENQNVIAVQIPIAEFEYLEELLENYGLLQLMNDPVDHSFLEVLQDIQIRRSESGRRSRFDFRREHSFW